jgi:hypothetical protein
MLTNNSDFSISILTNNSDFLISMLSNFVNCQVNGAAAACL